MMSVKKFLFSFKFILGDFLLSELIIAYFLFSNLFQSPESFHSIINSLV